MIRVRTRVAHRAHWPAARDDTSLALANRCASLTEVHHEQTPMQRFHETNHIARNFRFVIPGRPPGRAFGAPDGRLREAEANPESSNHRPKLLDSGFSTLGLRPTVEPRNDPCILFEIRNRDARDATR